MAEKKTAKKPDTKVEKSYDADALEALSIREQVRKRIGMWLGNSGQKGLHHAVYELVDNSVDEFMAGHGDKIVVEVAEDGWVTVTDNGRGIPVDIHKKTGLPGVEMVLTTVGGGGKYGGESSGYKVSGGLHGAGSSVVNFVSREMKATVRRDGHEWHIGFEKGITKQKLKKGKKTKETGTSISFLYDDEVFDDGVHFERETLQRRLRESAYLNPGLKIELRFHGHKPETFYAEGGIADYMKALVADRDGIEAVHKQPLMFSGSVTEEVEHAGKKTEDTTFIDIALYWTTAQNESWHTFTNAVANPEGGTHYDGLRKGLRKALNEAAEELGKFRAKDEPFEQIDTREGLFNAIHVKVSDPQFEGQTKGKLNNPEVEKRVSDFIYRELKAWLTAKENKAQADRIIQRVIEARDGRLAARKARKAVTDRKGLLGGSGLPGKLADCRTRDREITEIFIVEGDSAGGGMKKARDAATQAILPLRGKIQNAEKAGEATLSSQAIQDILAAIGGVITDVKVPVKKGGKTVMRTKLIVDVSEPRYGRIVLCSVDYEEMTFIRDTEGQVRCVRIGEFIDRVLEDEEDPRAYEVLCFDQHTGETRFKALKNVIRHPIDEPLYEARTAYGRKVRVTASHSVFVAENGEIKLKRGDELAVGDLLAAPRRVPLQGGRAPSDTALLQAGTGERLSDAAFNAPADVQLELLRRFRVGDEEGASEVRFAASTAELASQLQYLLAAHGVLAELRSGDEGHRLVVGDPVGVRQLKQSWGEDATAVADGLAETDLNFVELRGDLIGLPIESIEKVEPTNQMVYDFSVADDENFICGTGGICCHNTDADVDGGHIVTLLLTFFYRYAPDLIKQGRVYIAELPLYRVEHKSKGRIYVYSDDELQKLVKDKQLKLRDGKPDVQRFKGLGEMQPEQLAETALNPETRRLRQVTISDEAEAEDITTLLMGTRVERRREYIQEHALDIEVDV